MTTAPGHTRLSPSPVSPPPLVTQVRAGPRTQLAVLASHGHTTTVLLTQPAAGVTTTLLNPSQPATSSQPGTTPPRHRLPAMLQHRLLLSQCQRTPVPLRLSQQASSVWSLLRVLPFLPFEEGNGEWRSVDGVQELCGFNVHN